MIKKRYSLIAVLALVFCCIACDEDSSYSHQIELENEKIKEYIAQNNITVITEYPADSVFPENTYLQLTPDSIYFRLDTKGVGPALASGDQIQLRYIEKTLDTPPVVVSYWTVQDLPYPIEIIYGSLTNSCLGWQSAIRMMGQSDAVAEVIIPSKLGLSKATTNTAVTPYYYKLKIQIPPK